MMISCERLLNNLLAGPTSGSYKKQLHNQFLSIAIIAFNPASAGNA